MQKIYKQTEYRYYGDRNKKLMLLLMNSREIIGQIIGIFKST
jgi:hypothetical protein